MQFIKSPDGHEGVEKMAAHIASLLNENKKVLWLICGGSNIPLAKAAMDMIRESAKGKVSNLTIGQTDERFGPVGHRDSNWQQMLEAGFEFENAKTLPILRNAPLEETVRAFAAELRAAFEGSDAVIAQFGIGADGHVAGMLPRTGGLRATELAFGYDSPPFTRISMTPPAFARVNAAYAFAFGEGKRAAIENLQAKDLPIEEEPCQLLKSIPESYFYSDRLA